MWHSKDKKSFSPNPNEFDHLSFFHSCVLSFALILHSSKRCGQQNPDTHGNDCICTTYLPIQYRLAKKQLVGVRRCSLLVVEKSEQVNDGTSSICSTDSGGSDKDENWKIKITNRLQGCIQLLIGSYMVDKRATVYVGGYFYFCPATR